MPSTPARTRRPRRTDGQPGPHLRAVPAAGEQLAAPAAGDPRLDPDAAVFAAVPQVPHLASASLRQAVERAAELAQASLAANTLDAYTVGWRSFTAFCRAVGVPPLPAEPTTVVAYLAWLSEDQVLPGGQLRPARTAGTLSLRLSAINKRHQAAGLRRPGEDAMVALVMAGARRELGVRPAHRKDAVTVDLLRDMLSAAAAQPSPARVRDRALVVLGLDHRLTPAGLARLTVADVTIGDDSVALDLRGGRHADTVVLSARPGSPLCPVQALAELVALPAPGPALIRRVAPDGTDSGLAMTPEAIARIQRRWLRGRPHAAAAAAAAVAQLVAPPALLVRDRALLLTGFAGALRRSSLTELFWGDFVFDRRRGLALLLRRSKTDQEGEGRWLHLPYGQDPLTCPVTAWRDWRQRVATAIGADPLQAAADQPVFVAVDRHGNLARTGDGRLRPLSTEAVAQVVKRHALLAGLDPARIGGHSLRAGAITTLAEAQVEVYEIARLSGHKNMKVLLGYIRRAQDWQDNPSGRLGL